VGLVHGDQSHPLGGVEALQGVRAVGDQLGGDVDQGVVTPPRALLDLGGWGVGWVVWRRWEVGGLV
jgi:hypothetical protein